MHNLHPVRLEDFPALLDLGLLVEEAVENGDKYFLNAAKCIDFSYAALQGYVINSLTSDNFKMFVMFEKDSIVGFMTAMVHEVPQAKSMGFQKSTQLFIPTMFKVPGVGDRALSVMIRLIENWGKSKGAEGLYGNVSPTGALGVFLDKYGAKEISRTLYRRIGD